MKNGKYVKTFEQWENPNTIKGGLSDDKSVADVAKMHGLTDKEIRAKLDAGAKVEMEHTSDVDMAMEIALDHLTEDPNYYEKLQTIEKD